MELESTRTMKVWCDFEVEMERVENEREKQKKMMMMMGVVESERRKLVIFFLSGVSLLNILRERV